MSKDGHCMIVRLQNTYHVHVILAAGCIVCPARICNENIDLIISIFFQAVNLICG